MALTCTFLDQRAATWPQELDRLYTALGSEAQPWLLPPHFLKATFPQLGGRVALLHMDQTRCAVGFLFPRDWSADTRTWTLRLHRLGAFPLEQAVTAVAALLPGERIYPYEPQVAHEFSPDHQERAGFDIGAPDVEEAAAIRRMQQQLWGSADDALYPADLHAPAFRPGTSLVVRREGQVLGFLLGFYRFGTFADLAPQLAAQRSALCLESQLLGVLPAWRRAGLGVLLKQEQARRALAQGIGLIHWTVDPLQFANAVLNFGRLRALAAAFYPDYYPFRNELNRVHASRFGLVWPLRAARVQQALGDTTRPAVPPLSVFAEARRLNDGPAALAPPGDAELIAVEVPTDWTTLQRTQPADALRWRATTDAIFSACIGVEPGRYVVTDVAQEGERRFLVARRFVAAMMGDTQESGVRSQESEGGTSATGVTG